MPKQLQHPLSCLKKSGGIESLMYERLLNVILPVFLTSARLGRKWHPLDKYGELRFPYNSQRSDGREYISTSPTHTHTHTQTCTTITHISAQHMHTVFPPVRPPRNSLFLHTRNTPARGVQTPLATRNKEDLPHPVVEKKDCEVFDYLGCGVINSREVYSQKLLTSICANELVHLAYTDTPDTNTEHPQIGVQATVNTDLPDNISSLNTTPLPLMR